MRRRSLLLAALAGEHLLVQAAPPLGVHPRPLVFPADYGAHPETHIEWWYATGWLESAGERRGFQITFFRHRTALPDDAASRFAAKQLVLAHAAVSDLPGKRLRHDQRIARDGFGIASAAEDDTHLKLRDWRFERRTGTGAGSSVYRVDAASDSAGFVIALEMTTTQPLLLQGDAGFSRKGPLPAQASHYYSEPQLAVAGRLTIDGRTLPVTGRAWLDHEWSDSVLGSDAVGWDWVGMNLADGSALTAFRLRRADGSALWAGGSFRPPGAAVRAFGPDEVHFTPGRAWQSPATQARYPVEWQIDTPAGHFGVRALLDAQELDSRSSTGSVYWEGLSELRDAAGGVIGLGYLEMTGYTRRLQLG